MQVARKHCHKMLLVQIHGLHQEYLKKPPHSAVIQQKQNQNAFSGINPDFISL